LTASVHCRIAPPKPRGLAKLFLILAACCLLAQSTGAAPVKEVRRVLILHSLGFSSPASILVDGEIRAALDTAPYQIELYSESMQSILFSDPASQQELRQEYVRKYRDRRPDVVIAVSSKPIKFMSEAREEFGPNTPVVICASSQDQLEGLKLDSRFTGAWRTLDSPKTLNAALQLLPGTRHVVVVGGGVYGYDKRLEAIVREQLHSYESRFDFSYLSNLEMPTLLDRLRKLPENSIIIYTAISQDAAGTRFLDETQSLPLVVGAANAPVFVMEDTFVGQGTVGGYVTAYGDEGRVAGELAVRILKGEKPQDMPIVNDANVYMFDWRALQRWGISESALPSSSVVLDRQPTFWQAYKRYIVGVAVLCLAETLLIVALSWQMARRKKVEEALRQSEGRFRLAAQAGKMFAYEWDAVTDVVVRSAESAQILGIAEAAQLTGQQVLAKVHPDDREGLAAAMAALSPEKPDLQVSYRVVRPDGRMIWLERTSRAHFDGQGKMLRVVGMATDVTERKRTDEALASMSRRLIEAQEQERTRIARELHDDIGQRLALLAVELEQLRQDAPVLPDVGSRMGELQKQTSEIATDIQTLSHELHSAKLEYLGIAAAIRGFCNEFAKQQKAEIDFKSRDLPSPLSPEISLCLFRVLQEALHNSVKHSGVRHFEVGLWGTSDEIHLTVSDSGAGFDSEAARESRGLGLISMEERLKLLNGTFAIESQPHRGTTIHACVPLNPGGGSMRAAG
jgi:PAS domain S-box-containing protein